MSKAIEAELNLYEKERLKRIQQVRRNTTAKSPPANLKEMDRGASDRIDGRAEGGTRRGSCTLARNCPRWWLTRRDGSMEKRTKRNKRTKTQADEPLLAHERRPNECNRAFHQLLRYRLA